MSLLIGKTEYKYITTISTPYDGYAVAIPHPTKVGDHVRRNFFGMNRSQEDHLKVAIAWRDDTYAVLYGCALSQRVFHRRQANSKTDIPGVRRIDKIVEKKLRDGTVSQYRVPCILAEIFTIPGYAYARSSGSRSKVYSINKYGEEEAIKLAIAWRRSMIVTLVAASLNTNGGEILKPASSDGYTSLGIPPT